MPLYLGTGYSRMLLLLQRNKTYTNMKPAVPLWDPDRVLLSTLAGEVPTSIDLMNAGISSVHFTTRFRVFCRYTGAKRCIHVMVTSRGDAYILHYRPRFNIGKIR